MIIIGIVGLLTSVYLWYEYTQPKPLVCVTDCQKVRESKYANFLGVTLPVWGTLFYTITLSAELLIRSSFLKPSKKYVVSILEALLFGGFLYSLFLTYVEVEIIEAVCQWCAVSAVCTTLLFVINTNRCITLWQK